MPVYTALSKSPVSGLAIIAPEEHTGAGPPRLFSHPAPFSLLIDNESAPKVRTNLKCHLAVVCLQYVELSVDTLAWILPMK